MKPFLFLQKAIELEPNATYYLNLSLIYRDKKDFQKALDSISKVLEIEPDNPEAFFRKGQPII
ncbi:MAG: hypothetical protein KIIPBIDF_01793 [Candidatus Methanoperedenaceae archaeon GB50]|nr:MAG: hypothetical protein KIIPBIDF_01793 [Candidatus Methanoperedenaceae archaeon GB50]